MPPENDKSRIEGLKETLYSRNAPDIRTKRKLRYTDEETSVKTDWEHPPEEDVRPAALNQEYKDHRMSFTTKILIASAVFCILAVGLGAYLFFNGTNLISANNIEIDISGPVSIPGGAPVTFDVTAINKNNVDLQAVDMSVDFPDGTVDPADPSKPLTRHQELIGDMPAGSTAHKSIQAMIYGEQNLQKEITVTLTYGIKGSSSVFTKTQTYDVLINSSPINVTVSGVNEAVSGQDFDMTVDLKSNSDQTLKNIVLKASYPFGYVFKSSDLPTISDNATWKIGDIPPGGDRTVTLHGNLTGENTDLRAFHFSVGSASASDPSKIGTEFMSIEQDVTIQKPFVSLGIGIDNDQGTADHVGQFGQTEHVEIDWYNNLPVAVSNMIISAKLSGSAYDKNSVSPEQGYFDSSNDTIVWNPQTDPELASVAPGASGKLSFMVTPQDQSTPNNPVVDPTLKIDVSVSGTRAQEANVPESVTAAASRTTKISSSVALSGRVARSTGPFMNTGPIPPKAEQATTYTIIWNVTNASSDVGSAVVTAQLPAYVKWLGQSSPSTENVVYDQNSGTVTWNIGNVSAYAGTSNRRELDFQVSLKPSVSQVGQSPVLVGQATLSATDSFTGASLTSQQDQLTTRFSTDPAYQSGDETVVR
ncbi:MAG: hypothetical protein KGI45_02180 [Patescibacteria group bacterium]|nr:hypothetical protein [Patescibacteria group bacterium]